MLGFSLSAGSTLAVSVALFIVAISTFTMMALVKPIKNFVNKLSSSDAVKDKQLFVKQTLRLFRVFGLSFLLFIWCSNLIKFQEHYTELGGEEIINLDIVGWIALLCFLVATCSAVMLFKKIRNIKKGVENT